MNFLIKKFSFLLFVKTWFEPILRLAQDKLFLSGFFGSFYRCGGAAISEFRGAKTVRTILRIDHILENRKELEAAKPLLRQYKLSKANPTCLQFPVWWTLLESLPADRQGT
ncbi:MAG: hypothetical protein Q8R26_03860 [bacterium]|nr:hypothetical protein [bacterium]